MRWPCLHGGQLAQVTENAFERAAGVRYLLDIIQGLGAERPSGTGEQEVGEAADGVERGACLVQHEADHRLRVEEPFVLAMLELQVRVLDRLWPARRNAGRARAGGGLPVRAAPTTISRRRDEGRTVVLSRR